MWARLKFKNRVRSYFHSKEHDIKTQAMVSHIDDLDYIVVTTEREAFMLENNLIKRYEPLYNIELKDSRGYPYIRITAEAYPRLELARRYAKDGQYFGPYLRPAWQTICWIWLMYISDAYMQAEIR